MQSQRRFTRFFYFFFLALALATPAVTAGTDMEFLCASDDVGPHKTIAHFITVCRRGAVNNSDAVNKQGRLLVEGG